MELNHLRAFYEVAKAQGFSSAGRKLRISQSALSKAVSLLESSEGVKLLERGKKGVVLTMIGQQVFEDCVAIFDRVENIADKLRGSGENCAGLLRFGAADHLCHHRLVDNICEFQRRFPKIVPSLFSGSPPEILARIISDDLEFGLFFTRIEAAGIEYVRMSRSELVLVYNPSKDLPLQNQERGKHSVIASISREYQKHPSHRVFDILKGAVVIGIESNSQELQKQFCIAGGGYALLARFMVENEIKAGVLKRLKTKEPIYTDFLLAKRRTHVFSAPARRFIAEVVAVLKV